MTEQKAASPLIRRESAPPLSVIAWMGLAAVGVLFYYRQIFNLLRLGPLAWLQDNHSLAAALRPLWRAFSAGELPGLPSAWPEALARAGLALLGAGVVLLAAQVVGAAILDLIRLRLRGGEDLLFRTALGLGGLATLFLGLALAGWFTLEVVRGALLVFASGGLVWAVRQANAARQLRADRALRSGPAAAWTRLVLPRRQRPWILITLAAGGLSLLAALAPEVEYDALWYQLWLPELWLAAGRPIDLVHEYVTLYPLTWELLFGAAAALGGPVAAKLLHWICLPLGALLAGLFTRRCFPGAPAWLAAAIFVTVPTVFWEATTAYIDLALALYIGLAVYAALRYVQTAETQAALGWLLLAAFSLGLSLAIKHLALFAYLLIVPAVAAARWRAAGRWQAAVLPTLVLGGLSLLLPLPWYARAWLASGNPFFPDLYSIFGAAPPERWSDITEAGLGRFKERFGMGRSPLALLLLPWNVTMHAARFGGSLGPVFLLLLSGALFLPWRISRRSTRYFLALAGFCAGYLALWAAPVSSFQLRFLIPLTPLLAALAAGVYPRLQARLRLRARRGGRTGGRLPGALLAGGLAVLLLLNLPPFLSLHEGDRQQYEGWLTHVHHTLPVGVVLGYETQSAYLGRVLPAYRAWKYIHANLPEDIYVLSFIGGDHLYVRRARLLSDATLSHPAVWGARPGQEEQAVQYLLDLGITHVLVDKRQMADFSSTSVPLLAPEFIPRWLSLEYEDARAALYAINTVDGRYPWP